MTRGWIVFALAAAAWAASGEVKIDSGQLKGVTKEGVTFFKGIPYAAPPIGDLRWRPPQPPKSWTGVREASQYGADCMQKPFPGDAAPMGMIPAEDCLYLNLWLPQDAPGKNLPVIVWFYGGGFVNGGSSPAVYDGTAFARDGLVFVSFNYRLGRFGFFAHPALSAENPSGPLGNYGYMDQIFALQWVRRNIAAFGGNPDNVTIFGESAGGGSVLTMMTSPLAKGLFHRAVIESGGGRALLMGARRINRSSPGVPSAEAAGEAFANIVGIDGTDAAALAALRKLSAESVVSGLNMASMSTPTYGGPMIDGKLVIESPEAAYAAGRGARIPVIVGANSADIGFARARTIDDLFAPFGANKDKAKAAYDPDGTGNIGVVGPAFGADQMMVEPSRFLARTITAAGQKAYEYRFSYVAESIRKQFRGAPHATEIPFVFETVDARYEKETTAADRALARAAHAYWVNFAKTGNPNGKDLPEWPAYSPQSDVLLDFTLTGPAAKPDPWKTRLDLVEWLVNEKK